MKNWIRIFTISFVLLGGTAFFAYRSLSSFNNAIDSLSASSLASINTSPISLTDKLNRGASSTDLNLSFNFPKRGSKVFTGCTYQLSLQSSATIDSLETVLVDADTEKAIGPTASGLVREHIIEPNSQSLDWKVGIVWPGNYYIKVLSINGVELENYSGGFTISNMPVGIGDKGREEICAESLNAS